MASENWFIRHHDKVEHGPYPLETLVDAARQGNIATDTEVKHETHTRGQWIPATRVRPIVAAMPGQSSSVAPPPMQPPTGPPTNGEPPDVQPEVAPVRTTKRSPRTRRKQPAMTVPTSAIAAFFALFDFRFRYFVTPWIIKIYWAFMVFLVGAFLLLSIGSIVGGSVVSAVGGSSSVENERSDFSSRYSDPRSPADSSFSETVFNARNAIISTVFVAVTVLLALRVFLELAMVAFRIAEDLSDVRYLAREALEKPSR